MSSSTDNPLLQSPEAEALVLGRALQDLSHRKISCELLTGNDFTNNHNKQLFKAIRKMEEEGTPADISILLERLKQENLISKTGGIPYILELAQHSTWSVHIEDYAQLLKECNARRQAIGLLKVNSLELSHKSGNVSEFLETLTSKLKNLLRETVKLPDQSLNRISSGTKNSNNGFLTKLKERVDFFKIHKKPFVDGVSSGYSDLDSLIGGFCNSNLIILAGRPGMGKTALALNFLINVASLKHPCGIISLEMTSGQLYERLLSKESGVSSEKIREGSLSPENWESIKSADQEIGSLPVYVLEGECKINELVNKVRRLKEEKNISFFIIDYLQLIQGHAENRLQEISNITRALKNLSLELNLPILCLSQLSRKVEERTDKKPQLSDLRESGSIEQDADSVLFLMCPDYYDPYDKPGEANIIVAKNRHGQTGTIRLEYAKNLSKFNNFNTINESKDGYF